MLHGFFFFFSSFPFSFLSFFFLGLATRRGFESVFIDLTSRVAHPEQPITPLETLFSTPNAGSKLSSSPCLRSPSTHNNEVRRCEGYQQIMKQSKKGNSRIPSPSPPGQSISSWHDGGLGLHHHIHLTFDICEQLVNFSICVYFDRLHRASIWRMRTGHHFIGTSRGSLLI